MSQSYNAIVALRPEEEGMYHVISHVISHVVS